MYRALLYLQYHSLRNRLLVRLRRLRQPKYLVGGIVGAVYFYFYFFRYLLGSHGPGSSLAAAPMPANPSLYESVGASLLLVVIVIAWLVPHERAALAFTEAEVAFLFPAPISRRGLIHFKLLRSQAAILFTTFFLMLVTNRFGGKFWIHAAGWWLILSTLNLHFLGSSFARTMLLDRGIGNWQRRLATLLILILIVAGIGFWAWRTLPALDTSQWDPAQPVDQTLARARQYFHQIITAGPLPYLLFPFRLLMRPYLALTGFDFVKVLPPALLVLLVHYVWVIRSNVAFEEASVEASRKLAEKVTALRSGNWQAARQAYKGRRPPFELKPHGAPIIALLWKNLISTGQAFTLRMWLLLAVLAVVLGITMSQVAASSGVFFALGMAGCMLFAWSLFLGPQVLRHDLRQDLRSVDVLKMYPLPGWQLVLGELLAPAVILTAIQWCLIIVVVGLFSHSQNAVVGGMGSLGIGIGVATLVPLLNLILLQIPNAAVLVFPAWFLGGKEAPQGLEATGQRIIFMLAQLLVFLLTLLPASLVFTLVLLLARMAVGLSLALPLACFAAAIILAVEAGAGLLLLGWLFERFDVSAELNA